MPLDYVGCTLVTKNKIIPLKDKKGKSTLIVNNPQERDLQRIKVDDCLLRNGVEKCDFLVTTELPKQKALFVELKGGNVDKAISQLKTTLDLVKPKYDQYKKICRIVSTKSPLSSSEIQREQIGMRKKFQAELKIETIQGSVNIETV